MSGSLNLQLDAAKLAIMYEYNKNAVLQNQLELSLKEKSALERELVAMADLRKENALLRSSLKTLEKKNLDVEIELLKVQKDRDEITEKSREFEEKCSQLKLNVKSLEEKVSLLEDENHIMREKALSVSPKSIRPGFVKTQLEATPIPAKIVPFSHGLSESRRTKLVADGHQEDFEFLSRCIKEYLGFKEGKPLAACVIYRCLLHWHAFESERTAIFYYIIEGINDILKVGDENITLPYGLSNASALLCLLQRNLRSNSFLTTTQRSAGSTGLASTIGHGLTSSFEYIGFEDDVAHFEARYPALLFKQQLTVCVEKIFCLIRDNLKKELSPLLGSCMLAPKILRAHVGKSSRSPSGTPQQTPGNQWKNIIKSLDSLMSRLRGNHVPSFFIRKLIMQVFSFINVSLFNRLLLRSEFCTFSNGKYVKSGLAKLEKWIVNAEEEFAGTSWHELNHIRQAVEFLLIREKREKSLEEIRQDLCPALTIRQISRISTTFWDDKYDTQSVSNEVVAQMVLAQMREILSEDNLNLISNSFLLDDDLSIRFFAEDIDMAIPVIDPSDIELPSFILEYPCAQFLFQQQK